MSRSKYSGVVDVLGEEIAGGILPEGSVISLAMLEQRFDVSRTVAREAMRSLEGKGMIEARRRVGLIVAEPARWRVLDPHVIGWRLAGPGRAAQLRSLAELRIAVEPTAARLGAANASPAHRSSLVDLGRRLRALGTDGKGQSREFLEVDLEFHTTILRCSGNEMLLALEPVFHAVLAGRSHHRPVPAHPEGRILDSHENTAAAIHDGDPVAAEAHCRHLVMMVRREIS